MNESVWCAAQGIKINKETPVPANCRFRCFFIVRENPKGKEMIDMTMTKVEIDIPEEIVPYTVLKDKEAQVTRNAMLVYPYIKNGVVSHGKAAEMLGLHKIDLITLYGKLGLPYFDETEEEFEEDLAVLKKLRGATV